MISLTPEQIEYKEKTLGQLLINQSRLEASLEHENRAEVRKSIELQLQDIEAHINRLQDELEGVVIVDESLADDLFRQAAKALAGGKFFLAKKHIHRLETIEPFYPGLVRLHEEAETERVTRRTRSIAQGTATSYPGAISPITVGEVDVDMAQVAETLLADEPEEEPGWFRNLFQFHFVVSCLVISILLCVMGSIGAVLLLEWALASL